MQVTTCFLFFRYNDVALAISLAKPNLRAEFESDLKLICDGRKDPDVVRTEQIAKYKDAFQNVMQSLRNIDEALARRLAEQATITNEENITTGDDFKSVLKCPKCGNDMILRTKKSGSGHFLTCTMYPNCRNAIWFPDAVETVNVLDETCEVVSFIYFYQLLHDI